MPHTRTLFALLALCWSSAAVAEPLRLSKNFNPHPLVKEVRQKTERGVYLDKLGFAKCKGGGLSNRQPALTWELAEAMPELIVRIEDKAGRSARQNFLIVLPNGAYVCSQKGSKIHLKDWPRGSYKMYMYSPSAGMGGMVVFQDPNRTTHAINKALAKLPTIDISADGPNPRFVSLTGKQMAKARMIGMGCADRNAQITPLARLRVTRASTYHVNIGKMGMFIATADNKCAWQKSRLAVGTHTLWGVVPRGEKPGRVLLEVDDPNLPLRFGDRPARPVGVLAEPMVIDGKVRPRQAWPSRGRCPGAARDPDFYFKSDQPLQKVRLSLLWSRKAQYVHVFGPLAEMTKNHRVRCDSSRQRGHEYDIFEGTYAVWIGGNEHAAGSDYHLLLQGKDTTIDPLTALAEIPEKLTIEERRYRNHYPFFQSTLANWATLFAKAPKRLFVFPRVAIAKRDRRVPAGEPLLVGQGGNRQKIVVVGYNGKSMQIDRKLLTTEWPDKISLPSKPELVEISSVRKAIDNAGPEDAKQIAAYQKVDRKYTGCLGNYLAKHDPTWGKGHDVYTVTRGGKVTNVSDRVAARGAKKCGEKKLVRAEKKLLKKLAKTRAARGRANLKRVRARFGL